METNQLAALLAAQALHKPEGQKLLTDTDIKAFCENYIIAEYAIAKLMDKDFKETTIRDYHNRPSDG